ncbi:hypothetical protein BDF19DRAFT_428960, partial [Syncephalis fuscata]
MVQLMPIITAYSSFLSTFFSCMLLIHTLRVLLQSFVFLTFSVFLFIYLTIGI